jgi:hypothetical protein
MHTDPTDPTDPTEPAETAAPAGHAEPAETPAEAAAEPVEPAAPASPPDPAQERAIALDALTWCGEHPAEETAVETLNAVFTLIRDPEVRPLWIATVRTVVLAIAQVPDPTPALHAHMTVLVANLLELSTDSAMVDELLAAWLRHPKSFGSLHTTPAAFQRETFVQRLGDLLGWNALDLHRDRDALRRFADWVNTWNPRNKFRSRRALQALARNFPASDVWSRIHFPSEGGGPPHRSNQGRAAAASTSAPRRLPQPPRRSPPRRSSPPPRRPSPALTERPPPTPPRARLRSASAAAAAAARARSPVSPEPPPRAPLPPRVPRTRAATKAATRAATTRPSPATRPENLPPPDGPRIYRPS